MRGTFNIVMLSFVMILGFDSCGSSFESSGTYTGTTTTTTSTQVRTSTATTTPSPTTQTTTSSTASYDDHGDTIESASLLYDDSSSYNTLLGEISLYDVDYFKIILKENETITIHTSGSTDTQGRLYDDTGIFLLHYDDDSYDGVNFSMTLTEVDAGVYYLRVNASEYGEYALSIKRETAVATATPTTVPTTTATIPPTLSTISTSPTISDDHGDTIKLATILLANGAQYGKVVGELGVYDVDYFKITLSQEGMLYLYTTGATDTFAQLYDKSGNYLLHDDDNSYDGINFAMSLSNVAAGTYYLKLTAAQSGTYTIFARLISEDASTSSVVTLSDEETTTSTTEPTATPTNTSNISLSIPSISDEQKIAFVAAINAARSQEQDCGSYGSFDPVSPLSWDDDLYKAAYMHSYDMAYSETFSHTGSGTLYDIAAQQLGLSRGSTIVNRVGLYYYNWQSVGENIAAGTYYPSISEVMEAWMNSDDHCANIMSDNFTEVGVGLLYKEDSKYGYYWTQNFGRQ